MEESRQAQSQICGVDSTKEEQASLLSSTVPDTQQVLSKYLVKERMNDSQGKEKLLLREQWNPTLAPTLLYPLCDLSYHMSS